MIDSFVMVNVFVAAVAFAFGMWVGGWMRDRAWRNKANGPSRMLSGGRFYQVLTSEAYEELIHDAR